MLRLVHNVTTKSIGGKGVVNKLVDFCAADFRRKTACDVTESKKAMNKVKCCDYLIRRTCGGSARSEGVWSLILCLPAPSGM